MEFLLKEFPPVTKAEWEAAIARDLQGADYEKRLVRRTDEGLIMRPYYRAEDLRGLACLDSAPGEFPFRRGARTTGKWGIREEIEAQGVVQANLEAVEAIAAGADGVAFCGTNITTSGDLELLLKNLPGIPVHFAAGDEGIVRLLAERNGRCAHGGRISTGRDALANVALAAEIVSKPLPEFVPFTIHGEQLGEAGATAVEEIGFTLAAGVDFMGAMDERGVQAKSAAQAIEFSFGIGGNYFFEIAKLRAFRMVWARAAERFGARGMAASAQIAARTSLWNKAAYDRHVNILRETTEAMSAVLGGADWVTVTPFDACCSEPNEASRRLARNTQLILRHEAGLGSVADPAGGSYALESLTDGLARGSWTVFQQIERLGGFRKAEKTGAIAKTLAKRREAREIAVATRKRVLVGVNQHAESTERILDSTDEDKVRDGDRGARAFEDLRLCTEWHAAGGGKVPRILLAEFGDGKMRAARSGFMTSFFACAGFECVTKRFKKAIEIAEADCDLMVLCSSDAEYLDAASTLLPELKAKGRTTPVIVAGNPETVEELRKLSVADFVHTRSNAVEVLKHWQTTLKI